MDGAKFMKTIETISTQLNNEIKLIKTGESSKNIPLVIGVFHGDELQGKYLIEEYLKQENNTDLLFIPCLNPDGMKLNTRTNASKIDINRNFPTNNWRLTPKNEFFGGEKPASEIETRFLIEIMKKCTPSIILTLHTPYKVVNYDGPAREISERISKIINYPVEENIGYPTPGSFGTYSGVERNIPTVTLELDEEIPAETLVQPVFEIFNILNSVKINL